MAGCVAADRLQLCLEMAGLMNETTDQAQCLFARGRRLDALVVVEARRVERAAVNVSPPDWRRLQ